MGRLGIRIANIALFALCCFQIAGVFNKVSADFLMPGPASIAAGPAPAAIAARSWEHREPILDRNLFGAQMFAEAEPEPEPEEELEETKLPLRLLGTWVHSVAEDSMAAITDKSGKFPETRWLGDALERHPQARLVGIERGRVILDNKGRREELLLAEVTAQRQSKRIDRRRPSRRQATRAQAATGIADRLRDLHANKNEGRDARELFNQAKILPKLDAGEMVGVELSEIEPGSLYEKLGLSDGDVITSFNGVDLDTAAAGSRVLNQFLEAEEFEIELAGGELMTLDAAELQDILGSDAEE
ncbi:MAG: type II secretion system protein N [Myxococcota bacterium]|nr:type II secretion system protein N [Myxococcota bacterium]